MQIDVGRAGDASARVVTVHRLTASAIPEMAALSRRLFGEVALSETQLLRIYEHGVLLAVLDGDGAIAAYAQVITEPMPDAEEVLVRHLAPDAAYLEGVAVEPAHRGRRLAVALSRAADRVAEEAGKSFLAATVRVENAPSIRNLTSEGYVIADYDPDYYKAGGLHGARLIVAKEVRSRTGEEVLGRTTRHIELLDGADPDAEAHSAVRQALADGLVGVDIVRRPDGGSALVFVAADARTQRLVERVRASRGTSH